MPYIPGLRMGSTNIMNDIYNLVKSMEARNQIDLILDFSKAFDSLPQEHLLRKLGISNKLHNWIRTWLAIIVKGLWLMGNVQTLYMCVRSIPGDPYLAPLMFLLYINDIGEGISLEIKLFADDCQLYREVNSMEDALVLQSDLDKLFMWSREWQMRFNPTKCYTLRVCRLSSLNVCNYHIAGNVLRSVSNHPYLGVNLSNDLSWNVHITKITKKATKSVEFHQT